MKGSRQLIDEVEGLYLKIEFTVRERGSGLKFETIVPTGPVPADIIRQWLKSGRPNDDRDGQFLAQNIGDPVKKEFIHQLRRRCAMYPRASFNRIKDRINNAFTTWSLPNVGYYGDDLRVQLVNADGTPYDQTKFNRDAVGGLLDMGEAEGDLGWVDPNGILVPRWIYGEVEVKLELHKTADDPGQPYTFFVRVPIPWDVEWAKAKDWLFGWVVTSFNTGPPFNLDQIQFVKPEDEKRVRWLSTHYRSYQDRYRRSNKMEPWLQVIQVGEVRWVTSDGDPFPTDQVQRRHVKRALSDARSVIDHVLLVEEEVDDDEWAQRWCQENGSAIEIWGHPTKIALLRQFVESGAQVKSVSHPMSKRRLMKDGWTLFAEEYNPGEYSWDSYEAILIKR